MLGCCCGSSELAAASKANLWRGSIRSKTMAGSHGGSALRDGAAGADDSIKHKTPDAVNVGLITSHHHREP